MLRVSRSCELFPDGFDLHLLQYSKNRCEVIFVEPECSSQTFVRTKFLCATWRGSGCRGRPLDSISTSDEQCLTKPENCRKSGWHGAQYLAAHPCGCARCGAGAGSLAMKYQSLSLLRESASGGAVTSCREIYPLELNRAPRERGERETTSYEPFALDETLEGECED